MLDTLKDALAIGGGAAQIWNLFRDQKNPAVDAMMRENEERASLRNIALNPNSPEFKNYVAVQEEADRANFAKSMTDAINRSNRAMARGQIRTRPERQDEFYSTLRNRLTAGPNASDAVQKRLLAAAGTPDYSGAVNSYDRSNQFDTLRTDAAIRAGLDASSKLLDRWKTSNPSQPQAQIPYYPGPGYKKDESISMWEY